MSKRYVTDEQHTIRDAGASWWQEGFGYGAPWSVISGSSSR